MWGLAGDERAGGLVGRRRRRRRRWWWCWWVSGTGMRLSRFISSSWLGLFGVLVAFFVVVFSFLFFFLFTSCVFFVGMHHDQVPIGCLSRVSI